MLLTSDVTGSSTMTTFAASSASTVPGRDSSRFTSAPRLRHRRSKLYETCTELSRRGEAADFESDGDLQVTGVCGLVEGHLAMQTTPWSSPRMSRRWSGRQTPGAKNDSTMSAPHSSITRGARGAGSWRPCCATRA